MPDTGSKGLPGKLLLQLAFEQRDVLFLFGRPLSA
jgi:hypothetical protein